MFFVVSRGVKGGIEKANMVMMPTLIVMAIALAVYTLCQPGAAAGAAFYLVPDWSKFSPELIISALGQMFFSLSLAMGIMITYGSYMQKKDSLTSSAIRIGFFDVGVSFLAGLMIIPAAFMALGSGEVVMETSGPGLMFIVLPQMFADFGGIATLVGALFFLLVLFAALTSAISLVETCVSIIQDGSHWHRKKAMGVTFAVIFLAALVVNMGYNGWSFIEPLGPGTSILDFMDFLSNSVMMPVAALMTCIFVGWIIKPKTLEFEIEMSSPFRLRKAWAFMVKFIAPILIVIILVAYVAAQFGLFVM